MRLPACLVAVVITPFVHGQNGPVIATGAMRNTMFSGQLAGLIHLDSIASPGTYGIGPVEYLRGELMLWDGDAYRSTALGDSAMAVVEHADSKAPFFVHQRVNAWADVMLPDSVIDLRMLDAFLTARFAALGAPFAFTLRGTFSSVHAHIVDVPRGEAVNGPDEAHRHNKDFHLESRVMDLLGFFSTKHKAVFTHHDTNIHVHAITAERDWMGHVEETRFDPKQVTFSIAIRP